MKCAGCEVEETEENREELDLRRPGKLSHRETVTVVSDMEKPHYCHICRSEEEIYTAKEIAEVLGEHGYMDGMGNVRASKLPEQPLHETVKKLKEGEK